MRTPGLQMAAVKIQHKDCLQSTLRKKKKHIICRPRSVCMGKNSALGLEYDPRPAACGLRPYSRPLAQFFPTRTPRPASYIIIYIWFAVSLVEIKLSQI